MQPADIQKGLQHLNAGKWKIKVAPGDSGGAEPKPQSQPPAEDETTRRALAHPDVQRFRELFPDSEVRVVRNLKD
jgi:hypothetical protein